MGARDVMLANMRASVLASQLAEVVRWHSDGGEEYVEVLAVVSHAMGVGMDAATDRLSKGPATVRVAERAVGARDEVGIYVQGEWVRYSVDHERIRQVGTMINVECVKVVDGVKGRSGFRRQI